MNPHEAINVAGQVLGLLALLLSVLTVTVAAARSVLRSELERFHEHTTLPRLEGLAHEVAELREDMGRCPFRATVHD